MSTGCGVTAETPDAPRSVADRLAAAADELRALADELRAGQGQAEPESAEPEEAAQEERTTSGAAALRWLNERHPVAPAAGQDEEDR